ncbi:major facilitator superfamily domain-containing protein [Camillea tinctor]|nr:major facilitator superfamily domain-containing protein [Camillea tinctor]
MDDVLKMYDACNLVTPRDVRVDTHVNGIPNNSDTRENASASRGDYACAQDKSDHDEIRLFRKLDLRVLPVLWFMYFSSLADRGALAQARLNSLEDDLHMRGNNFNIAISILTVGYVLTQVPSNMLLTRVRPGLYLALVMFFFACTRLVNSYESLIACRFLLGFFEAPIDLASRIVLLDTSRMAGLSFANLIAAGVFEGLEGARGLRGWRWLFIIEGAASGVTALAVSWLLPDTNETTRWLSQEEREIARIRMQREQVIDTQEHEPLLSALQSALRDPRMWLFCAMENFHFGEHTFTNFLPTVVRDLGFTSTAAFLLTCLPYVFACIVLLFFAWSLGRFCECTIYITIGFIIAIIGFVAATSTLDVAGRYVVCFVFSAGAFSASSIIIGWTATTMSQSQGKKSVALALLNVSGQISQIYGAYFWPESDGPRYVIGFSTSAAFSVLSLICSWIMRCQLKRQNRQLQQSAGEGTVNL